MREFPLTPEFRGRFRRAARRYLDRLDRARRRIATAERVEAASKSPFTDWRVQLADALSQRECDRVSRAEGRVWRLIRSITDDDPVPGVEIGDDPIIAAAGFPAVECEGYVFAIVGAGGPLVVRPAWMTVRLDDVSSC